MLGMAQTSDPTSDRTDSSVVLGTMTFGEQADEDAASEMVAMARDGGVVEFDTANSYTGGRSEEIVGGLLAPVRDQVRIVTKVANAVGEGANRVAGLSPDAVRRAVDDSLRRLGTDYVDLCYLHRPDWDTPIEQTLEVMAELLAAGKVREWGVSNYAAWQITEMIYLAERHGWPRVRVSQVMYNLLARRVEAEYAACSRRFGLTDVVYNPLAGGLLTGKHAPDQEPPPGSRFTRATYRERYWNEPLFAAVDDLRGVAAAAGVSLLELALRWVRDRPLTDRVLLGASSVDQLRANLDAVSGPPLDADTVAACDAVWERIGAITPEYNR